MSQLEARNREPAPVFAALGSTTRLELLARLCDGKDHSITELTDGLDLTRQAVTKHLRVLQQAGIIDRQRIGRESRFAIQPERVTEAKKYLDQISDQWNQSIARLREAVES